MDKLTIEQKAQRYDEAIKVAKRKLCFDNAGMIDNFTPDDIREIFPELKKPEDEEIRKYVINIVNQWWDRLGDPSPDYPTQEDMLNWFEKQNPIMAKSPQLGEQKPAWSKEDEKMRKKALLVISDDCGVSDYEEISDWLKSLKQRIGG